MACLILSLTASLVMWSLYEMSSSFLKHLISVACNFFRMSAVNVQVSQAYNSTEITRERITLILVERYTYRSRWSWVLLLLLLSVQFWTVLQAWNPDLWRLRPDTWSCQPRNMLGYFICFYILQSIQVKLQLMLWDSGFFMEVYIWRPFCGRKISPNVLYCYSWSIEDLWEFS